MSMIELNVSFPEEKLQALRFFISKKDQTIEHELQDYLNKTYEKMVPAQVREYVESSMEQEPTQVSAQEPTQQQAPEQSVISRERSARQTRRQKEQTAPEPASAPEAPSESEGPAEQENQGMTMSM